MCIRDRFTTAEMTFIQEKTDEQMMGRVFSLINIIVAAAMPLAMIIFGPLSDAINIRYVMIGSGLLIAILAICLSLIHIYGFDYIANLSYFACPKVLSDEHCAASS